MDPPSVPCCSHTCKRGVVQGLKDLGETAGPITDTTRPFVEKKYYKLLAARKDLDTESDEEPTVPPVYSR